MANYATDHLGALQDIRNAGADVTFTNSVTTTTESTDVESAPVVTTVTGAAIRVTGNPATYGGIDLTVVSPVTLLFAPDTYGERPVLGSTVSWEGDTWTVQSVAPLSPSGSDIISRVVVI